LVTIILLQDQQDGSVGGPSQSDHACSTLPPELLAAPQAGAGTAYPEDYSEKQRTRQRNRNESSGCCCRLHRGVCLAVCAGSMGDRKKTACQVVTPSGNLWEGSRAERCHRNEPEAAGHGEEENMETVSRSSSVMASMPSASS
jgi:hypothetical protein